MGEVWYDPDTANIVVSGFTVEHPDVVAEAAHWVTGVRGQSGDLDGADLSAFLTEAVIVGARVLSLTSQSSDTLAVTQAVQAASEQVDDAARRTTETMVRAARDMSDELNAHVARLLGGDNPELADRLRPLIETGVRNAHDTMRAEADQRHRELAELIYSVERHVAVKTATTAVRDATTLKGFDYETRVNEAFATIASGLGDHYTETGATAGRLPRNKKGDGVLSVHDDTTRIVIEAHDGTTKDWGPYLAEAERNRGAHASIGCVRNVDDNLGHTVRLIGKRRIIVAYDPENDTLDLLRAVTLLMRTAALSVSARFGTEEVATASEHVREAISTLNELDDAKRSAAAIAGHVTKIENTIEKTVASLQRDLHAATTALLGQTTTSDRTPGTHAR